MESLLWYAGIVQIKRKHPKGQKWDQILITKWAKRSTLAHVLPPKKFLHFFFLFLSFFISLFSLYLLFRRLPPLSAFRAAFECIYRRPRLLNPYLKGSCANWYLLEVLEPLDPFLSRCFMINLKDWGGKRLKKKRKQQNEWNGRPKMASAILLLYCPWLLVRSHGWWLRACIEAANFFF